MWHRTGKKLLKVGVGLLSFSMVLFVLAIWAGGPISDKLGSTGTLFAFPGIFLTIGGIVLMVENDEDDDW